MREADLTGARCAGSPLRDVDLSGALLRGADLSGCDLRGSDLGSLEPESVRLRGAIITIDQTIVIAERWGSTFASSEGRRGVTMGVDGRDGIR